MRSRANYSSLRLQCRPACDGVPRRCGVGAQWRLWLLAFTGLCLAGAAMSAGFATEENPAPAGATLASGTKLYVRLITGVSTVTSHLHQAVTAQVVRDAVGPAGVLVPIGSEVAGTLEKLIPSSDPNDHARVLIRFDRLTIPNRTVTSFAAHLVEVENAREAVLANGTIQGILAKDAAVGRMNGMLDKLGSTGAQMQKMQDKTLGKLNTTIDLPPGTDLVLVLDQALTVDSTSPSAVPLEISPNLEQTVQQVLADAPQRAQNKAQKPGDPLNLVVAGSAAQILEAFKQAGWSGAAKLDRKSAIETVRAVAGNDGYDEAPVSQLYLFGRAEDLAFEKMLNTFMKRHHLRLWRTTATTADGREIWLGASTHDIGLDVHPGVISHAIDTNLDSERDKVGADLMAGGKVAAEHLVAPPHPLSQGMTATGGTWKTDGQLLVIELRSSAAI